MLFEEEPADGGGWKSPVVTKMLGLVSKREQGKGFALPTALV